MYYRLDGVAECYTSGVRRVAQFIVIALLTFGASGVWALVLDEPCRAYEQSGREDGACPPTCVTCACCAQAVEPAALLIATSPEPPIVEADETIASLPKTDPRDILHVPKLHRT